ncbi:MAG: hypothetical protein MUE72_12720 [Chitinophagaceae bacterium]|jgi:hypothetical protein|nr:hypothetical protein [Chitinophagaceae bacterium]
MKWRSLRRDEGVKPFWQKGMIYYFNCLVVLYIIRFLLRLKDKDQNTSSEGADLFYWVFTVAVVVFFIPGLIYLIKPKWFMVNKAQKVEVSDTSILS